MSAKYILRFDDITPDMNWNIWDQIEKILVKSTVKPILAVVPENRDPKLSVHKPREDFWDKVRYWQSLGWAIGLHGYQHLYQTKKAGIIGINRYSEFAGLAYEEQFEKLSKAVAIFQEQKVNIDIWIAPAHSFDWNTVKALQALGITKISDGFFKRPVEWRGSLWIPQQLWKFQKKKNGIWTICYHANNFTKLSIDNLKYFLSTYSHECINSNDNLIERNTDMISMWDHCFALVLQTLHISKQRLGFLYRYVKRLK